MKDTDKDVLIWFFFVLLFANSIGSIIGQCIYHHLW
jgi:hypothetical protein